MNSTTTDDEGTEKCYFCEKTFKDKEKLEAHMNSNSCYQKEFECSFCDKIFPENYKLQRHIKFVHSKVKNAKCTMCEKEFPRKYDLERHINNVHDRDELIFRHAIIQNVKENTEIRSISNYSIFYVYIFVHIQKLNYIVKYHLDKVFAHLHAPDT